MVFSFMMPIKLIKPDIESQTFPVVEILRIVCNDGTICDFYCSDNAHKSLSEKLTELWRILYSPDIFEIKSKLDQVYITLIHTGYELSQRIYDEMAIMCTETAWLRSYYFERQGSLIMLRDQKEIPVYLSLYRFCLIIQKEKIMNEFLDVIQLKFAVLKSIEQKSDGEFEFQINCYNNNYTFISSSENTNVDWINTLDTIIKSIHGIKNNNLEDDEDPIQSIRYHYTSPLPGKLSIKFPTGEIILLKKAGPWIIGRASVNDVVLNNDEVSRNHCKIELINNVPYLLDLGSRHGTRLNSERIKISAPLKPGDVIQIGKQVFTFEVKNGDNLFRQYHMDNLPDELQQDKKCSIM